MLRHCTSILIQCKATGDISRILEGPQYQCVRWRKPYWLPVAKSKLFRIPARYPTPEEELVELRRLQHHHNTYIKSISKFLAEEVQRSTAATEIEEEKAKQEQADIAVCHKMNDEWNSQVAQIREKRLGIQRERERQLAIEQCREFEKKKEEEIQRAEKIVRIEKERSKYYITEKNIDEAIEKALASEVDYNFSIDVDGNIYRGHKTKQIKKAQSQEMVAIQG